MAESSQSSPDASAPAPEQPKPAAQAASISVDATSKYMSSPFDVLKLAIGKIKSNLGFVFLYVILSLVLYVVSVFVLVSIFVSIFGDSHGVVRNALGFSVTAGIDPAQLFLTTFVLFLVFYGLATIWASYLINFSLLAVRNNKVGIGEAFKLPIKRGLSLYAGLLVIAVVSAVLFGLLAFVLGAIGNGPLAGVVLLIAFIVYIVFIIKWFLYYVYVVIDKGIGGIAALTESPKIGKGSIIEGLGFGSVILLATFVFQLVFSLITGSAEGGLVAILGLMIALLIFLVQITQMIGMAYRYIMADKTNTGGMAKPAVDKKNFVMLGVVVVVYIVAAIVASNTSTNNANDNLFNDFNSDGDSLFDTDSGSSQFNFDQDELDKQLEDLQRQLEDQFEGSGSELNFN